MARLAAKYRGDERALEEEAERTNPLSGRGATPSMGLSQYRGGDHCRPVGAGRRVYAPRKRLGEDGHGVRHKPGAMANAMDMGLHLGKHLHSLHGAGFFDSFVKGLSGALPLAQTAMKLAPMFGLGAEGGAPPQQHKRRVRKGKLHFGSGSNSDTGQYEGEGRESDDAAMTGIHGRGLLGQDGHGQLKGGGFLSDLGIPIISDLAGAVGLGHEETTGGRRRRAPAGANDGRRKRAEIVKRVMREKGMKMIAASQYVKANGLY